MKPIKFLDPVFNNLGYVLLCVSIQFKLTDEKINPKLIKLKQWLENL